MSQKYYKLYIDSILDLAATLVIKSEDSAIAINTHLKMKYGDSIVDPNDPSSWKYYKNICGQYHSTDEMIYVTSLDTLEKIPFTTDFLSVHKATEKAYKFNSRNYRELLSIHPDKEQIILGVLYPADMDHAITSTDGTILSYPNYLVESNEITLIEQLNKRLELYKIRWSNPQFDITDSLYSAAHLGLMYLHLVPVIINIRLAACKTNEAHSFHVRQYLSSHGMLDAYLNQMTRKQALFLYRNISYIERNNGKKEIFAWLLEHLMTERSLPLSEYTMKHNETDMLTNIYPEITFKKKLLNVTYNNPEIGSFSLKDVLTKEENLAVGNVDYIGEHYSSIKTKFDNSLSSVVATKMLESSVIDYTDATPYTFQSIVLNEWIDLSFKNLYNVYISFKNPRTGEKLSLLAKDAYIYMMYILAKRIGSDITRIPSFLALRVQRLAPPTVNELMSIVDSKYIDRSLAIDLIKRQPIITPSVSVEAFYNQASNIYSVCQDQIRIVSSQEHQFSRALVANMVSRFYTDNVIKFEEEGMLFSDWLVNKHLPDDDFNDLENATLYIDIFENATGSILDTTDSIRNLQKAMLNIFKQLSSYSVQFVSELNTSNIKVLNWAAVRVGDISSNQNNISYMKDTGSRLLKISSTLSQRMAFDVNYPIISFKDKVFQNNKYLFNSIIINKLNKTSGITLKNKVFSVGSFGISPQLSTGYVYNNYPDLTDEQKLSVKDIYTL